MKKLVLVVEDDPGVANLLARMLKHFSYEYQIVVSTSAALRAVESIKFDILLTDLGLPKEEEKPREVEPLAGIELAQEIIKAHPEIKVIFCTGKDPENIRDKLPFVLSRVSFLLKPIRLAALEKVLLEAA